MCMHLQMAGWHTSIETSAFPRKTYWIHKYYEKQLKDAIVVNSAYLYKLLLFQLKG